jgi:ABC-type nitrate/sulfonate/bicarbonate transport system substrate-binding protein
MLRRDFLAMGAAGCGAAFGLPGAGLAQGKPQNQGKLQKVNIVTTSGTTNLVLTQLLQEMGYLKEFGIEANYINVADGNKIVAALISGAADICPAAGITQVLAAIARGASLKICAGAANKNFNAIFSGNPAVKTLKDLEGRTVGVGALGTQLHQTMIALFRKYGVDASKVRFANVGASTDVFKAVTARTVDAGPAEVWLEHGSNLHILENGKTFESLPEYVNQASFTADRAIASKRDALVRTLAAYAKLYRFIMSGNSEAAFVAACAKALGKNDPDFARGQWRFYREIQPFAGNLELPEDRVRFMQDLNVTTQTQKAVMPYAKVADMSLARDALKLVK